MAKIAYIASRYPAISHTFIAREIQALRRRGFEIDTFSIRRASSDDLLTEEDQREDSQTCSILPAGLGKLLRAHFTAALTHPLHHARALWQALWHRPPGWMSALWHIFYFAEAGCLAYELRKRGITHIHAHFANVAANVARLAARMVNGSWSMTLHGLSDFGDPTSTGLQDKLADARLVICVSDFGRAQAMLLSDVAHWPKIHRVRCGIDTKRFQSPAENSDQDARGSKKLRVLTVARLGREKAIGDLLHAVQRGRARGTDIHVTLVGSGPEQRRLETLTRELNLDPFVTFAGPVGQDRIRSLYQNADVFVLPSWSEGLPVVLMEAMAMGLPVVATHIMGVPELVEHNVSGLLVPPGREDLLADALVTLGSDRDRLTKMGKAARNRVVECFDSEPWFNKLAEVFAKALRVGTCDSMDSVGSQVDCAPIR